MTPGLARTLCIAASLCVALALAAGANAETTSGWRADGTGKYPDAKPPTAWSPTSNVLWRTHLPGYGNSTPIVVGKRLFVCREPSTLVCLDAADGQVLWQRSNNCEDLVSADEGAKVKADQARTRQLEQELGKLENTIRELQATLQDKPDDADTKAKLAAAEQDAAARRQELAPLRAAWYYLPGTHPINGYASATPVTDGKRVFAVFGTGMVAAYDLYGARLWAKVLEKPTISWGFSASPIIAAGKLIVHVANLSALDPATGKVLWQTPLPESWGTPAATRIGDADVIITPAGDVVRAADGAPLAKGPCALEYSSPVVDGGVAYFIQRGGRALQLPAELSGNTAALKELWTTDPRNDRYYASPVVQDGLIYACTQANAFSVIDAATGTVVYERMLSLGKGTCYPSVALAGGLIFVSSDSGRTAVIKPGRKYEEVAVSELEPFRASPVFAGNRVYIHSQQGLWCLGAPGAR